MRVAFIIPEKEYPWDSVHQGIGYIAAYAARHFPIEACRVFLTNGTTDQELTDFLSLGWDVIGFSLTQPGLNEAKEIFKTVSMPKSAKIVVGGSEPTSLDKGIFDALPEIDYSVVGEGEITFLELLQHLCGEKEISRIKGLIYRKAEGLICENEPRPFEKDLEVFPCPDRSLFPYRYEFHSIIGTRGCPYHCTFCNSSANWRHSYRLRKPTTIAAEIKSIINDYGREKYIAFKDDSFNINQQWTLELCSLMEKLRVRWWIRGLRASAVTAEVANGIVDSGCMGASCGVESANDECLKTMKKGTTIEEIMKGVELLQSRGMPICGQFIIGNQADTLDTIKESIECAKRFSSATFGVAYPLPHTVLHEFVTNNRYF
jgi:anaerobic magnesium-protoporphyrin IX monomethyl ester cyclase